MSWWDDPRVLDLVIPATAEPISTDLAASHLRVVNGSVENDYLDHLVRSARQACERFTGRALMPQTFRLSLEGFPCGEIELPRPPVTAVTAITYVDQDGVTQTWDSARYQTSLPGGPNARMGRIRPAYNEVYPTTRGQLGAVQVTYQAGYVDTEGSPAVLAVPDDLIHGMLLVIGELYKTRTESVQTVNNMPAVLRAQALWAPYRVW